MQLISKRLQVLTAVLLKIHTFWDVMLCLWASSSRRFDGSYCVHLQELASVLQKTWIYKRTGNVRITQHWSSILQPLFQWKRTFFPLFRVCVCSLRHPACSEHEPYCHLWPVRLYKMFPYDFIKKTRTDTQTKFYKVVARPSLLYVSETWVTTKWDITGLEAAEMRFLRSVTGYTRLDKIRSDIIIKN